MPAKFVENLYIYTENFFLFNRLKVVGKRIIRTGLRGPSAVEESLLMGLYELNQPFRLNENPKVEISALILSGAQVLKSLLLWKKSGKIKQLITGPNIVNMPQEKDGIICSQEIDKVLVPSQWSAECWAYYSPKLKNKINVWAAGVKDRGFLVKKNGSVLVFQKNSPSHLLQAVLNQLEKIGLKTLFIEYGKFTQHQYFRLLSQSRGMVYLSESESQGLALLEAWSAGLPTLVWSRGYMQYKRYFWNDPKISCPYLNEKSGLIFTDEKDFPNKLALFLSRIGEFSPREYYLHNFTNKISAQKLLKLF